MRAITPRLLTLVDPACAEAVQWARRAGFDLIETVYGMRRTHVFMAVMGG